MTHFTPWDHNWPYGPPPNAQPPKLKEFEWKDPNDPCNKKGSIIACESQNLAEEIPVTGTPLDLRYDSSRQPGYKAGETLSVPVTGPTLPDRLKGVQLSIDVAGKHYEKRWCDPSYPTTGASTCEGFDPLKTNLNYKVDWDGKDAFGRPMQGRPVATIKETYVYEFNYYPAQDDFDASFSAFPEGTSAFHGAPYCGNQTPAGDQEQRRLTHFFCGILSVQEIKKPVGPWDVKDVDGLGGLTLSAHHGYDPQEKVTYLGNGGTIRSEPLGQVTRTLIGGGADFPGPNPIKGAKPDLDCPSDTAVGPDGSVFGHSGMNQNRIWRLGPDGNVRTIAGIVSTDAGAYRGDPTGDEGPATQAKLGQDAIKLAAGPDGTVYFTTWSYDPGGAQNGYVRSITPDGIIHTIAGRPWDYHTSNPHYIKPGEDGDGGPAKQAALTELLGITIGPDGAIYIGERAGHANNSNALVKRIGPDGTISTVAGGGSDKAPDDEDLGAGEPARSQALATPYGLAATTDGSLYITDPSSRVVQRVGPDGMITRVAGNHANGVGWGKIGADAPIGAATDIAAAPDGTLVVRTNDIYGGSDVKLVRISNGGLVTPLAGTTSNLGCQYCLSRDGEPANGTRIESNSVGVEVLPDGRTVYADGRYQVRVVEPALPGFGSDTIAVPSTDGREVYVFNGKGRHMRTVDALTGATLLTFGYDDAKRLSTITDASGNVSRIDRAADGTPQAIVAPGGQRTALTLDGQGRVQKGTDPAGDPTTLVYGDDSLLSSFALPGRPAAKMDYDPEGRLIKDTSPTGAVQTLERTETDAKTVVKVTSGEGRVTTYTAEALPTGERRRTIERPTGATTALVLKPDGTQIRTDPDGTKTTVTFAPDPRWGMRAPVRAQTVTETPSGHKRTVTEQRTVDLADPNNPLSVETATVSTTVEGQ